MSNNKLENPINALFVYYEGALDDISGGVQLCSKEYFDTLTLANFSLRPLKIENDRTMANRVKRKINPEPYNYLFNPEKAMKHIGSFIDNSVKYVFLNQYVLRPLARLIKDNYGNKIKVILLSHGLASVDYLHEIRAISNLSGKTISNKNTEYLGKQLIEESSHATYLDHVFCLSQIEVEIEKWLGAKQASHIPRTINEQLLAWTPQKGRVGFVGRLDHPPNKEGLELILEELNLIKKKQIELHIVGAPIEEGKRLSDKYGFVKYLGELSDEELRDDVSTWSLFLHPVFCYAMGCSTKLAVAIGWGIPILTTRAGVRGYVWKEGELPREDLPKQFAQETVLISTSEKAQKIKQEVLKIRESTPNKDDVALLIKEALKI